MDSYVKISMIKIVLLVFSATFSFQFYSGSSVDNMVKDSISQSGFVEVYIPFSYGQLRTYNSYALLIAVFEYLQDDEFDLVSDRLQAKSSKMMGFAFFRRLSHLISVPSVWAMAICSVRRLRLKYRVR